MQNKWNEISENLRKTLAPGIFKVWVARLAAETGESCLRINAPNPYVANWLRRNLSRELLGAASAALGRAPEDISLQICAGAASADASVEEPVKRPAPISQGTLPIRNAIAAAGARWHYSFEDFVTGPSNNLAVAAARDMCEVGQVRTLFVNSAPGLGKTHLAQATGSLLSGSPVKVAYLTAEQFASRYVAAMRAKELETFKQYLCGLDVLLFEDIHFLQRKRAMQEMILGVIKNLQDRDARVIFTSSFAPRELQEMDSQLVSYFCSGILTSMEKPNIEMRREILQRKAKFYQAVLPDEVCDVLSRRLSSDVRQLESCLKNMIFKARLLNSGLTVDLAMETASQFTSPETALDVDNIVRMVCESFGLTRSQLCSRSRRQEYVQGRNTIFYLARKHTELSLEEIGCIFNRTHSTVLRSLTQVEQELARESSIGRQIARTVSLIERKCGVVPREGHAG